MDYIKRFALVGLFSAILIFLMLFIGASSMYAADNEYMWPTDGQITDTFGTRGGDHDGIDIAAKEGANVFSAESGEIIRSDYSPSYGNVIIMSHDNDDETVYAHLSKRVKDEGDIVSKGEVIGKVGNTGHSRGSHLHFELHKGEWTSTKTYAVNPLPVLKMETTQFAQKTNEKQNKNNRTSEVQSLVQSQIQAEIDDGQSLVYTIEKGDTLWDIAQTYDTTVQDLQETNDISGSLIYPDEELVIHKDTL